MDELRKAAQAALEAMESLLAKVRRDAPQLSGKLMGHCENVNAQLRAALAQPDPLPGMSPINRSIAYSAAQTLRDLGYEWDGDKWAQPQPEQQAEPVECARCGHMNWIMLEKAPCQIVEADKAALVQPDSEHKTAPTADLSLDPLPASEYGLCFYDEGGSAASI